MPPIALTIFRLLAAIEAEVIALGGDGGVRVMVMPAGTTKASRRLRSPASRPQDPVTKSARGRLVLGKSEVLYLYQQQKMSCSEIASIAGVSSERVRQILLLFGIEGLRRRQRRERLERYCQQAFGV
jgi:hypothetical protein